MNSSNLAVLENLSPRSERLGSGRSFVLIIEDDRFSAVALSMLLDDW